ncbi:GLPGLI family protein [Formosa sediminum]|uniref:GLPGLI family protein n=1 Tax=Formosa sediminum TaxID=2594004 RepID=A0A516GNJ3_9FLAO|nr:GLPGLI family protein [Formosa sediminum]QDO93096.1 GLPGLI family protein [Formosa sediminum]
MKNIITYVFLLISSLVLAQNKAMQGTVVYSLKLNIDYPAQNTGTLYFSDTRSCYVAGEYTSSHSSGTKVIDYDLDKDDDQTKYYVNTKDKTLHTQESVDSETYLIFETLPKISWDISFKDQDTILGQLCNKAVGEFRGRRYIAWFAMDIPVRYGPWKLQGLPGLILKIKDTASKVDFLAISLNLENTGKLTNDLQLPTTNIKPIQLKPFIDLKRASEEEFVNRIIASMPRDRKVTRKHIEKKGDGMERIFEWEEENETESN